MTTQEQKRLEARVNDYFMLSNRPTGGLSSEQLDLVINPTELMSELFKAYKLKRDSNYELLEVVQAMATFDGRNNNAALKQMAQKAIAKAEGK